MTTARDQKNDRQLRRRKEDQSIWSNFKYKLVYGDIAMVLIIGAIGLLAWVGFGFTAAKADLHNYSSMFPIGSVEFWVFAYVFAAFGMLYLAAADLPPLASLVVGGWLVTIWSWSFFARATTVYTAQTGNATSIIYIIIGALILQRSGKRA